MNMESYLIYGGMIVETFLIIFYMVRYLRMAKRYDDAVESLETTTNFISEHIENASKSTASLQTRVDAGEALLALIDTMIVSEIISRRKYEIFLGEKNKNLDVDNMVRDISQSVFKGLNDNIFENPDNIFTDEYIMAYIQHRTVEQYLSYIKENIAPEM